MSKAVEKMLEDVKRENREFGLAIVKSLGIARDQIAPAIGAFEKELVSIRKEQAEALKDYERRLEGSALRVAKAEDDLRSALTEIEARILDATRAFGMSEVHASLEARSDIDDVPFHIADESDEPEDELAQRRAAAVAAE